MPKLPFEKITRERIYKKRIKIKKRARRRAAELLGFGIINLDKPAGIRSCEVVKKLRELFQFSKVGYSGTLDPMVTGVLPIGLGKAVRVLPAITFSGKVYICKMHLHDDVPKEKLEEAFQHFTGKIVQLPPRKCAVKRVPREREIYWIKLKKFEGRDVEFEIGCQHGVYIRKLCHDIGEWLGVGAHMVSLKRIQSGPLKIEDAVKFEVVKANYNRYLKTGKDIYIRKIIIPPERAVQHLPRVWVDDKTVLAFSHGSPIFAPGIIAFTSDIKVDDVVAVYDKENNLIGFGLAKLSAKELEQAKSGLAIKTDVVLIARSE